MTVAILRRRRMVGSLPTDGPGGRAVAIQQSPISPAGRPGRTFCSFDVRNPDLRPCDLMIDAQTQSSMTPVERFAEPMTNGVVAARGADDLGEDEGPEMVIRPRPGWIAIDWQEIWSHRELLAFLVWRDIAVRYKQTVLGPAWAILQPLIMMAIFTVVFGRFAQIPSEGFPYPVFVFAGLIPWTLFSQGMPASALSLISHQQLLTKVYFPRLFVPAAAAVVFVVDLLISMSFYVAVLLYYGVAPSWGIVWLPVLILLTLAATLGMGISLAALTVFYRDFKHIVPFLTMIMMYITPVIYPVRMISPKVRIIMSLNPMFGIVGAFRSAILGLEWDIPSLAISTVSALGLFTFSLFYFRKTERRFADYA
jgi:lipopolysaccharide transport system permease protein